MGVSWRENNDKREREKRREEGVAKREEMCRRH